MTATATKPGLQGTIETIYGIIKAIGPATERQIEQHPAVVAACRSSKLKARRLVHRLEKLGHIESDGAQQQPKFRVAPDDYSGGCCQFTDITTNADMALLGSEENKFSTECGGIVSADKKHIYLCYFCGRKPKFSVVEE